jgi:hypothetical protein
MDPDATTPIPIVSDGDAVSMPERAEGACVNGNGAVDRTEQPVADFLEPIEWKWTEAGFEARQALKRYSEETHADS